MRDAAKIYVEEVRSVLARITALPLVERQKQLAEWKTPLPRHLYHYRGCTGINDERNLRDLLVSSQLFLRAPSDFNDPFECRFQFGNVAETTTVYDCLVGAATNHGAATTDINNIAAGITKVGSDGIQNIAIDATNARLQAVGIFCLSESYKDILMWAHYGESHRGVCVEFDVADGVQTFGLCKKVSYDGPMPTLDYPETSPNDILNPILRKAHHWYYEQEWRVVIPSGSHQHLDFPSSAISSVVYGCAAEDATYNLVRRILEERRAKGHPPVLERRVKKADREYVLVDV